MSYLNFVDISDRIPTKKTKTFEVQNKSGQVLAEIKWSGAWRKYVFHSWEAQYDTGCMNEIIEFINNLMNERKNK